MPTIFCENLTKRYGSVEALRGLSFAVENGGCIGFLGPNGAGKTTTIRILTGLASPTGGKAVVDGLDAVTQRDQVRSRIGYLAQSPAFYNYMTGEEFMLWTASLFHLDGQVARSRTEELLKRVSLWEARRRAIGGYSGGMRQRLGLAHAMINKPKILFLDEPVSALDPIGRHEILTLIDQLRNECTVFMSTHVLGDVERVCDRVIIVRQGTVAVEAAIDELREQYASPVFTVEVETRDADMAQVLQALPFVGGVRRDGAVYRVAATDVARARRELPQAVVATGVTLLRYGVEAPNLEDIFLKVVGTP